jgi:hypothetical protein
MEKDKQDMGPHQYETRIFNAEVNLISEWVMENNPQLVKHKRYIHRCCRIIMFLYQ